MNMPRICAQCGSHADLLVRLKSEDTSIRWARPMCQMCIVEFRVNNPQSGFSLHPILDWPPVVPPMTRSAFP